MAIDLSDLIWALVTAAVTAGIIGYVLGHSRGVRAERRRWVRDRLERACRLPEKVERR